MTWFDKDGNLRTNREREKAVSSENEAAIARKKEREEFERAFLVEVERRAGASREEMLSFLLPDGSGEGR